MKKFLLCSQDRPFISRYTALLREEGIECDSTSSLDSFISTVEISAPSSLAGFLDLNTDEEEVAEILNRLHSTARGRELPLIILHHNPEDIRSHQRAVKRGVDFFFTKPVETEQLVHAACTLLRYAEEKENINHHAFIKMRGYLRSKTENTLFFQEEPPERFAADYRKITASESMFRQHPFPTEKLGEAIEGNHEIFHALHEKEAALWMYLFQYIRLLENKIDTLHDTVQTEEDRLKKSEALPAGTGNLLDMSGGGCRFKTDKILEVGDLLYFKIVLESFPPDNVIGIGIITHSNTSRADMRKEREYALKFVAINHLDKEKLIKYTIHLEQLEIQRQREKTLP